VFSIGAVVVGDFHIKIQLKNKEDGFEWVLIATYGAAQEDLKEAYLTELVQFCSLEVKPLLIRGDFNIIRKPSEKNNDRYNAKWPFLFNACIESLDLRELAFSGRQFIWANSLESPTFERLA